MLNEQQIQAKLEHILVTQCSAEEACADCPEILPRVRQALSEVRLIEHRLEMLFPSDDSVSRNGAKSSFSSLTQFPEIAGYEVESLLGSGGMGVVYKAKHLKLNRIVALKMLRAGRFASRLDVARFIRESQAVANLQHPNIVQVHDVGDLEGCPFFTMEFVEGGTLAQDLAGNPLPPRRAANLMVTLADAVQSAHLKGVIHRDLKPANILFTHTRTLKIADFGLARNLDGDSELTISGTRLGTPSYMAPEQAIGDSSSISPLTDVYALGAILYEMLTGRPPFRAATAIETQRQLLTLDPVRPTRLNSSVPRDLETICLKCLQKEPENRYSSASELADDLRRYLDGHPVHARPIGLPQSALRWAKRNKGVAAALSFIFFLSVAILFGSLWSAAHFRRMEFEQRTLAAEKGRLATEMRKARDKAVSAEQNEATLRRESVTLSENLRQNLYLLEMNLAGQYASLPSGLGRVSEYLANWDDDHDDVRKWEWYYLNSLCHRSTLTRISHAQGINQIVWSPVATRLASASRDGSICIWDNLEERPTIQRQAHDWEATSISWSPDGKQLASAGLDQTIRIWDASDGKPLNVDRTQVGEFHAIAWSPDGKTIATGANDGVIRLLNAEDLSLRAVLREHSDTVTSLSWSPNSQKLASASRDTTVRIWDVTGAQAEQTLSGATAWVRQVAWSPDGVHLASASDDGKIRIWNLAAEQAEPQVLELFHRAFSVAWSPTGAELATTSDDKMIRIWSAKSGAKILDLQGHTAAIGSVAWCSTDGLLATADIAGVIKLWQSTDAIQLTELAGHHRDIQSIAWRPTNPNICASADMAGVIKIWDVSKPDRQISLDAGPHAIYSLSWSPKGTHFATGSADGVVRIWNADAGEVQITLQAHEQIVRSVAWSPDASYLATGGFDDTVHLWDASTGEKIRTVKNQSHYIYSLTWSPDGRYLASAAGDRTARVWEVATGEEIACYRGHTEQVTTIAWSPSGTMIASGSNDQMIHLWDFERIQETKILRGHTSNVIQVAWHPKGSRLASVGQDGHVKLWDVNKGLQALALDCDAILSSSVAWSSDGMTLATVTGGHRIQLFSATQGYQADRSQLMLPEIERRIKRGSATVADWKLRAEIYARKHDWKHAAEDLEQYLKLRPAEKWFMLDGVISDPYSNDLKTRPLLQSVDYFHDHPLESTNPLNDATKKWRTMPLSAQGAIDFQRISGIRDHVSVYALFPVYSPHEQQVALLFGADDNVTIALNREILFQNSRVGPAQRDENVVLATLQPGWNSLLFRVVNEAGSHALYLRLSDSQADLARAGATIP